MKTKGSNRVGAITEKGPLPATQLRAAIREKLAEADAALEDVRALMVYADKDDVVRSEDVHKVAMAQFEVGKLVERWEPKR